MYDTDGKVQSKKRLLKFKDHSFQKSWISSYLRCKLSFSEFDKEGLEIEDICGFHTSFTFMYVRDSKFDFFKQETERVHDRI